MRQLRYPGGGCHGIMFGPARDHLWNQPRILASLRLRKSERSLRISFRPARDKHRRENVSLARVWQVLDGFHHRPGALGIERVDQVIDPAVHMLIDGMSRHIPERVDDALLG